MFRSSLQPMATLPQPVFHYPNQRVSPPDKDGWLLENPANPDKVRYPESGGYQAYLADRLNGHLPSQADRPYRLNIIR